MQKDIAFLKNRWITRGSLIAGLTAIGSFTSQIQEKFGTAGLIVSILIGVTLALCANGNSATNVQPSERVEK